MLPRRTDATDRDEQDHDQRAETAVATAQVRVGIALRRIGDLPGSERELRAAIARYYAMINRGKAYWGTVRDVAMAHYDLADPLEPACGKSRAGRQSPYQLDLSAPPRPNTSCSGMSGSFMSGVGTPTSTTVPARSRA